MRILEFLDEAISVTPLKVALKQELNTEILDSVHQIYYKESKLDPKIKEEANREVTLNKVLPIVEEWMREQLNARFSAGLELLIEKKTGVEAQVRFKEIKVGGYASGIDLVISDKHIKDIAHDIVDKSMYQMTLDNTERENEIVDTMFRCYKIADVRHLYGRSSDLNELLDKLVTVIIHELTHVIQHSKQFRAGRTRTEYRSYLEKNKEKFYATINKMHKGEQLSPEEYKMYYSSPQEIGSFSQEAALKFVNDISVDELEDPNDFKELRKEIPNIVKWYVEKRFHNPSNPKEYAVFKRFNKLMYQEIMRYIDDAERRLNDQIKKKNAPVR